ncbi:MAG: primosomal protein N' [Clostridia bacterium]|nr:primosomal protein N' [Clostridia bacterium]
MFARVIVDISNTNVDKLFTYSVPDEVKAAPGQRVLVPFGRGNKPIEGFIIALSEEKQTTHEVKHIIRTLEPYTVLTSEQLTLSEWICAAYHCTRAESLRGMIPAKLRGSRVKEKTVRTLRLSPDADRASFVASISSKDGTVKAPKQLEVYELLDHPEAEYTASDIGAFIPGAASAISALVKKGILIETGREIFRNPFAGRDPKSTLPLPLVPSQAAALNAIREAKSGETLLLHGVTGSGKTEVYMQAIAAELEKGRGAIVLVPEISLTPQTTDRFRSRFGNTVAVLHSHLSDGERFDEWRRIRFKKARVVIGARSAVFAPVEELGLIIIDEEHEPSYQSEQTPKYSAVEVARRRARITGARLVLGSATPSLTSYYRAKRGQYKLIEMPERINGENMPRVDIVDMRSEYLSGNNGIFSKLLKDAIAHCLKKGEQAILFLNRRGYSSHVECRACGFVFTCKNCDVAMTYHKFDNVLRCHYCGATAYVPNKCPSCGSEFVKFSGMGTQQVEEQLQDLFPEIRTLRMDTDTTGGKNAHRDILDSFTRGEADVLIGTQMVAKGLDIPNVTLVGVVFADSTLFHSDYRSGERTFQLLTQVAGRAGRADKQGRVVIQTNAPNHRAIALCTDHDYKGFYNLEIGDRLHTLFPPFSVFVRALFVSRNEVEASEAAGRFSSEVTEAILSTLSKHSAENELIFVMPGAAPIRKRDGEYRYAVIIKLARTAHTAAAIEALYQFASNSPEETCRGIEVNPQDML